MSARPIQCLVFAACACALAGCATPQAALDQANNGAALSMTLQVQLAALRSAEANVAKAAPRQHPPAERHDGRIRGRLRVR